MKIGAGNTTSSSYVGWPQPHALPGKASARWWCLPCAHHAQCCHTSRPCPYRAHVVAPIGEEGQPNFVCGGRWQPPITCTKSWLSNDVVPQRMNIGREQMVVAWREPPVLKMPWFLLEANFEMPWILMRFFAWMFRIPSSMSQKNLKFFDQFYYFLYFFKVKNAVNWEK